MNLITILNQVHTLLMSAIITAGAVAVLRQTNMPIYLTYLWGNLYSKLSKTDPKELWLHPDSYTSRLYTIKDWEEFVMDRWGKVGEFLMCKPCFTYQFSWVSGSLAILATGASWWLLPVCFVTGYPILRLIRHPDLG